MDTINKWLSFEYFWAWCIPLVSLMMWMGPNEIHEFEQYELGFLWICWWFAYPPQFIKYIGKIDPIAKCVFNCFYWSITAVTVIKLGEFYFK